MRRKGLFIIILIQISSIVFAKSNDLVDSLLVKLNKTESQQRAIVLNELSDLYSKEENYLKAITYKSQEKSIYQLNNQDSLIAQCNTKLGLWYYHIGSYNSSIKELLDALIYYEDRGNGVMVATISTHLANVNTRLENYKSAINYMLTAKHEFEKTPNKNDLSLAGVYTNLGLAYADFGKLDSAMFFYNKALELTNENNKLYVATIKNNMGEVYYKQKLYFEAINHYQESYNLFEELENENGKGASLANVAKVKIATGDYEEAIELSERALINLKKINALYFIVSTQQQIYEAYKGLENYKMALKALEVYLTYNDSLKGSETKEYVASLEMQYKLNKEQQKIKILEQEVKIKEKEYRIKKIKYYIAIGSVIVLLIVSVLVTIYLRASLQKNKLKQLLLKQDQEKLENDLVYKQRELESFANYVKEKNQLLENLKTEIKEEGKKKLSQELLLKNITNVINRNLHIDNDRKKLELQIDLEHQEFVKRLKEKYQNLTKNDIRLCSLLLLDMSTKEIATVMNIEAASVKMNRNRLRKKLLLPKGTDILKHLNGV